MHIEFASCSERVQRDGKQDDRCNGRVDFGWNAVVSDGAGGQARCAEASRNVVAFLDAMFGEMKAEAAAASPARWPKALDDPQQDDFRVIGAWSGRPVGATFDIDVGATLPRPRVR